MKLHILASHITNPSNKQRAFTIESYLTDSSENYDLISEVVVVLNESGLRDCIFEIEEVKE